jgi:hypothetical protein
VAALTHAQEYAAVREAIQQLTTLDTNGNRRDRVSISIGDATLTYGATQLQSLQSREETLARRLSARNTRKRTLADFGGTVNDTLPLT